MRFTLERSEGLSSLLMLCSKYVFNSLSAGCLWKGCPGTKQDGAPCTLKGVCTVWVGGKGRGDFIRALPIDISRASARLNPTNKFVKSKVAYDDYCADHQHHKAPVHAIALHPAAQLPAA